MTELTLIQLGNVKLHPAIKILCGSYIAEASYIFMIVQKHNLQLLDLPTIKDFDKSNEYTTTQIYSYIAKYISCNIIAYKFQRFCYWLSGEFEIQLNSDVQLLSCSYASREVPCLLLFEVKEVLDRIMEAISS